MLGSGKSRIKIEWKEIEKACSLIYAVKYILYLDTTYLLNGMEHEERFNLNGMK